MRGEDEVRAVRLTGADSPIAIICGGGSIPFAVADAIASRGRKPVLFAIENYADPERVAGYTHHWVSLGRAGRLHKLLLDAECHDVVFIGQLVRPRLRDLRFDWQTIRLLPRITRSLRGGDNHLLSAIGRIFEEHGFRMVGAHEVAPEILVPQGVFGCVAPRERDLADIAIGLGALDAIGPFDVGQAAVVADNHVLAIEGIEGTDLMLARVAELRRIGRIRAPTGVGVVVKAPKRGQDLRYDLPSIGPAIVEGAVAAGLAGIAVVAGAAIVADPDRLVALADRSGVFVAGVRHDGTLA
jgi:UDP-2,3-diacylglucosamine hydrolase